MYVIKLSHVIILTLFSVTNCQRRIEEGVDAAVDKKYMVYLIKAASVSPRIYDEWLCGGAIVSTDYVLTSAACIEDVRHIYVIAGYNKYIKDEDVPNDKCVQATKRKVVFTCVPKAYELVYQQVEKWAFIDIALVKVDKPYDFTITSPVDPTCSYVPEKIKVNYEKRYQMPGVDAMVLGWGHTELWRKPEDKTNYNQPNLQYASVVLVEKATCKEAYTAIENMDKVIEKYMLCSDGKGNIDEKGDEISTSEPKNDGCDDEGLLRMGLLDKNCPVKHNDDVYLPEFRRNISEVKQIDSNFSEETNTNNDFGQNFTQTRRTGICQNDHGGPLVTWIGAHEAVIGVSSVFRVNEESKCVGPFLYTSTQCNGAFINCIINSKVERRNEECDKPPKERGFDIIENYISWKDHPDGPAENEKDVFEANTTFNAIDKQNINKTTLTVKQTLDTYPQFKDVSDNMVGKTTVAMLSVNIDVIKAPLNLTTPLPSVILINTTKPISWDNVTIELEDNFDNMTTIALNSDDLKKETDNLIIMKTKTRGAADTNSTREAEAIRIPDKRNSTISVNNTDAQKTANVAMKPERNTHVPQKTVNSTTLLQTSKYMAWQQNKTVADQKYNGINHTTINDVLVNTVR